MLPEKTAEILKIAQALIPLKSTKDNPDEIQKCLEYIKNYFQTENLVLKQYTSNDKPSLVIATHKTKKPKIFLVVHIDVVEGEEKQFIPKIKNGKLYGRGADDKKTFTALAMVLTKDLAQLKNPPDIGLMITSDQEIGGEDGTQYLLEKEGYSAQVAFLPEHGINFGISNIEKGVIHLKISARGKSAHGARPWMGKNALDELINVYTRLHCLYPNPENENDWKISLNLGKIEGGEAVNRVPDWGAAYLDLRYTDDYREEQILRTVRKICKGLKLEVIARGLFCYTPEDNLYLQQYKKIEEKILSHKIEFQKSCTTSDGRFFTNLGIPTILSRSPGSGSHTDNEWVEIEPLGTFYQILWEFILSL